MDTLSLLVGLVIGAGMVSFITTRINKKKPVEVAGSIIPELDAGLDLTKYFNVFYTSPYDRGRVREVKDARILGCTKSSSAGQKGYFHANWLVLEHKGGRKVMILPDSVFFLEEVDNGAQPEPADLPSEAAGS